MVALGAPLGVFIVGLIGRKPTLLVVAAPCVGQLFWTLTREREALGVAGIGLSILAVILCLVGFEKLRAWGAVLVGEVKRRRESERGPGVITDTDGLEERS